MRPLLHPVQGEALTYWFSRGRILYRGRTAHDADCETEIGLEMAQSLRAMFRDEIKAAFWAEDESGGWRDAVSLWRQLGDALDAQDDWLRRTRP